MTHRNLPLADLIAHIRRAGAVWFNNRDLMLLEELIRRAQIAGVTPGDHDGQRKQPVRDVRDSTDFRPGSDPARDRDPERGALTAEEIAQIEAYGRDAYASLLGETG